MNHPRILAISGGIGGAKLALGLDQILEGSDLAVLCNTGDDFEHLGLSISPDLDTVMYTLAGLANPETGWGRKGESWQFMETLETLGGETWFRRSCPACRADKTPSRRGRIGLDHRRYFKTPRCPGEASSHERTAGANDGENR